MSGSVGLVGSASDMIGYFVYGIGGLVIVLFLGSAILNQRKAARAFSQNIAQEESEDFSQGDLSTDDKITEADSDEESARVQSADKNTSSFGSKIKTSLRAHLGNFKTGRAPASVSVEKVEPGFSEEILATNSALILEPLPEDSFNAEQKISPEEKLAQAIQERRASVAEEKNLSQSQAMNSARQSSQSSQSSSSQNILSLLIVAPRGQAFYGDDLLAVFEREGLVHGKYQIFHALNLHREVLFSVASAIKPGSFDLDYMNRYTTPGLNFFMDLGESQDPKHDFKKMLGCVYEVATDLGGEILDSHRERLTQSSVAEYLAKIKGLEASRREVF